jgi:hypothetical protein
MKKIFIKIFFVIIILTIFLIILVKYHTDNLIIWRMTIKIINKNIKMEAQK